MKFLIADYLEISFQSPIAIILLAVKKFYHGTCYWRVDQKEYHDSCRKKHIFKLIQFSLAFQDYVPYGRKKKYLINDMKPIRALEPKGKTAKIMAFW